MIVKWGKEATTNREDSGEKRQPPTEKIVRKSGDNQQRRCSTVWHHGTEEHPWLWLRIVVFCTQDKPISAQSPQRMPKGMDTDCTRCTLIVRTMVSPSSKIPAFRSIVNASLQKSYSVYFLNNISLLINLPHTVHSISVVPIISVPLLGTSDARLSALSLRRNICIRNDWQYTG